MTIVEVLPLVFRLFYWGVKIFNEVKKTRGTKNGK